MRMRGREGGRKEESTYLEVAMDDVEGVHVLDTTEDLEKKRRTGGREGGR